MPFTVTNGPDANGVGGNNDRPDFNPTGRPACAPDARGDRDRPGAITGVSSTRTITSPRSIRARLATSGSPAYNPGQPEAGSAPARSAATPSAPEGSTTSTSISRKRIAITEGSASSSGRSSSTSSTTRNTG